MPTARECAASNCNRLGARIDLKFCVHKTILSPLVLPCRKCRRLVSSRFSALNLFSFLVKDFVCAIGILRLPQTTTVDCDGCLRSVITT